MMTWTCGCSVFQWSTATHSSQLPRSRCACAIRFSGKGLEVGQLGRVVRGYDEPEMMPVVVASLCEAAIVGVIACGIEHTTGGPIFGYALSPQISQMSTERSSVEPVPHHACLYYHST